MNELVRLLGSAYASVPILCLRAFSTYSHHAEVNNCTKASIQDVCGSQRTVLWNDELGRALVIDFHRSALDCRPKLERSKPTKRDLPQTELHSAKRLHVL